MRGSICYSRKMHIAYFAGLLDGEGSIMLLKQGPGRCRVAHLSVGMTDERVIRAVKTEFEGFIRVRPATPARQAFFVWNLKGIPALNLLEQTRPYLVIQRRAKLADILLSASVLRDARAKNKQAATEQLFQEMRALNSTRLDKPPKIARTRAADKDVAYLAGILDGEGHIDSRLTIDVHSTDPELPVWLQSRFEGKTYAVEQGQRPESRPIWRWQRHPTGFTWAAGVADHMLIERKKNSVLRMENFHRKPPPGASSSPHPADELYVALRKQGWLVRPAARESGLPHGRALFLEKR